MSGMRVVAAYLLATLGGNPSPTVEDVVKILSSVGIPVELEEVKFIVEAFKSRSPEEVIREGRLLLEGHVISFPTDSSSQDDQPKNSVGVDLIASYWLSSLANQGNANPEHVMKLVNSVRGDSAKPEEVSMLAQRTAKNKDLVALVEDARPDVAAYLKTLPVPTNNTVAPDVTYKREEIFDDEDEIQDFGLFD